jgi:hypothetical protein
MNAPWSDSVEFMLMTTSGSGVVSVGSSITMTTVEHGELIAHPTFRLTRMEAQQLLENLWQCGLRPLDGTGSVGQLGATERHLEDMRRLVFGKPGVEG